MMINRPSTLCNAQSINRSANPNDNKGCTVMHFTSWSSSYGREFIAFALRFDLLCEHLSPLMIPYLFTKLIGYSMNQKITHDICKLTQTY